MKTGRGIGLTLKNDIFRLLEIRISNKNVIKILKMCELKKKSNTVFVWFIQLRSDNKNESEVSEKGN